MVPSVLARDEQRFPAASNLAPSANRTQPTLAGDVTLQARLPTTGRLSGMKAIFSAALAAVLSGILVGVLLKKKVAEATQPR